jgi:hypothetical protein
MMLGHQLRDLLIDIKNAINASGSPRHAAAVDQLQAALSEHDELPISDVAQRVEATIAKLTASNWEFRLNELVRADLSEPAFLKALDELRCDKSVNKGDMHKIAEAYVGFSNKGASREKLLDAIKSRFYGKIYDRDANEMAKRATPW